MKLYDLTGAYTRNLKLYILLAVELSVFSKFFNALLSFLVLPFLHSFHKEELVFSSSPFSEVKTNSF